MRTAKLNVFRLPKMPPAVGKPSCSAELVVYFYQLSGYNNGIVVKRLHQNGRLMSWEKPV